MGRVSPELWGQIGPMGSGGRRGSWRPRRTVCADDTDGKVGDSLEATRERSPTVPTPVTPLPHVGSLGRRVVRSVGWEKRRRGCRRSDPAGGDADTRPFSRGGVTEKRFAGDPPLSCLLRPCRRRVWHLVVQIRHRTANAGRLPPTSRAYQSGNRSRRFRQNALRNVQNSHEIRDKRGKEIRSISNVRYN